MSNKDIVPLLRKYSENPRDEKVAMQIYEEFLLSHINATLVKLDSEQRLRQSGLFDDLRQNILIAFFQTLQRRKFISLDSARGYLYKVCKSKFIDWVRSEKKQVPTVPLEKVTDRVEQQAESEESEPQSIKKYVSIALERLNHKEKRAMKLRLSGAKIDTIKAKMGFPSYEATKQFIFRTRRKFRGYVEVELKGALAKGEIDEETVGGFRN